MNKVRTYWPSMAWIIIIMVATLMPSSRLPDSPNWEFPADKLAHLLLFMIFSLLVLHNHYRSKEQVNKKKFLFVVTLGVTYGLLLEMAQHYIPGRNFSWLDLLADGVGSTLGVVLFGAYVKYKGKLVLK